MSGGYACACEKGRLPMLERPWRVTARRSNRSAFNGGHWAPSQYSAVICTNCGRHWRTKAAYVRLLRDAPVNWAKDPIADGP